MNIPYMIGRRATVKAPVTGQHDYSPQGLQPAQGRDTANLRTEDGGRTALRTVGWSVATFGAGAILGWVASGNVRRKDGSR